MRVSDQMGSVRNWPCLDAPRADSSSAVHRMLAEELPHHLVCADLGGRKTEEFRWRQPARPSVSAAVNLVQHDFAVGLSRPPRHFRNGRPVMIHVGEPSLQTCGRARVRFDPVPNGKFDRVKIGLRKAF
jgi:hypothetical protein